MHSSPSNLRAAGLIALLVFAGLGSTPIRAADSEAIDWLRGYLRIDSSNPPGRESAAAAFLGSILHREGISTETHLSPELRPNLVARIEGSNRDLGTLVLLHHLDVVPPGAGWSVPPFEARIQDGRIWGRGAIDTKSLGIAHLAAFLELARSGVTPERDVVFLATADEETGGGEGARFLLEERFRSLGKLGGVLTEGGANQVFEDRLVWWGVEAVQKRPLWLRLSAKGRSGHGSSYNPSSASHQLLKALGRLLALEHPMRITAAGHLFFRAVAPMHSPGYQKVFGLELEQAQVALDAAEAQGRLHEARLPSLALLVDTVQVTTFENFNDSINAVPATAQATVDVRLLPDTDQDHFLTQVKNALGDSIEVEVLLQSPSQPVPRLDDWLWQGLGQVLSASAPVVPAFISGTTDARHFRQRGIPTYGFSPFRLISAEYRGVHGADESISIEKFERGVETMVEVVQHCALSTAKSDS